MTLVLVGTPIGNLGDLSPRAVEALAGADAICCEDTRRTGRLLQHAGVGHRPLIVVNDHTEAAAIPGVLARLAAGERVAVVTDAGMPGISDPGERLVRAAVAEGHTVEVVPGPSAAVTALVASGLPTGRYAFEGFLPRKGSGRTERLAELAGERRTTSIGPRRLRSNRSPVVPIAKSRTGCWPRAPITRRSICIARSITVSRSAPTATSPITSDRVVMVLVTSRNAAESGM